MPVRDHDLARESFRESSPACAFIIVSDTDGRVQARNGTARQTGGATALFHGLVQRGPDGRTEIVPISRIAPSVYHSGSDLRCGAIDIAIWQRIRFARVPTVCALATAAIHIDQAGLNNRIARLCSAVSAGDNVGFEHVIVAQDILYAANFDK